MHAQVVCIPLPPVRTSWKKLAEARMIPGRQGVVSDRLEEQPDDLKDCGAADCEAEENYSSVSLLYLQHLLPVYNRIPIPSFLHPSILPAIHYEKGLFTYLSTPYLWAT
jgi:hypothetical protein